MLILLPLWPLAAQAADTAADSTADSAADSAASWAMGQTAGQAAGQTAGQTAGKIAGQTAGATGSLPWSASTGLLFVGGQADEIVYKYASGSDLLSLLIYPVPPAIGAFIDLSLPLPGAFTLVTRMETAWPLWSGIMTDDDWFTVPSVGNEPQVHSDATAYLTAWLLAEVWLACRLVDGPVSLDVLAGLRYRQMSWEGWDAYQISSISGYTQGSILGYVIDYRQNWIIPWLGFSGSFTSATLIMDFALRLSPWLHVRGRDVHRAREPLRTFIDVMYGGFAFSPAWSTRVRLADRLWLLASLSIDIAGDARGDTFVFTNGFSGHSRYDDTGGASYILWNALLGLQVRQ
jgi:outer membrane protease